MAKYTKYPYNIPLFKSRPTSKEKQNDGRLRRGTMSTFSEGSHINVQTARDESKRNSTSKWGLAEWVSFIVICVGSGIVLHFLASVLSNKLVPAPTENEKAIGIADLVLFFVLTYFQFLTERRELIWPMKAALETQVSKLEEANAAINELSEGVASLHKMLPALANTRRISNGKAYIAAAFGTMENAIKDEPPEMRPCLRLLRMSGHWRMQPDLKKGPDSVSKYFDSPGRPKEKWADRWTVKILYAVADETTLDELELGDSVLAKLLDAKPVNVTFKMVVRHQFEPLVGGLSLGEKIAFLAFDEPTSEPFPEEGLSMYGEPVKWFGRWFDEMFSYASAREVFSRGRVNRTTLDEIRRDLREYAATKRSPK
jgi:hypothetical protein